MRPIEFSPAERGQVMATGTPARTPARTPAAGPAPLFAVFLILWLAFVAALIFNPGALDSVWNWLTALPLVLQIVAWVLFLPVTLGLWIWESDWALWLRLALVIVIAVGNIATFSPRPRKDQERDSTPSDLEPTA